MAVSINYAPQREEDANMYIVKHFDRNEFGLWPGSFLFVVMTNGKASGDTDSYISEAVEA